jgi:hypothetical protein
MMSKMNWTLSTLLGVASFVVATPQASAQQLQLGTFKLPVAAHFGDVVLQPGEYTITKDGMSAIRIRGEGGTVTMLANSIDSALDFRQSKMTLLNFNGAYALTRFESEIQGRRYDFVPDKNFVRKNSERASAGHQTDLEVGIK